jgi:predicted DNA-binding transcriptional regulator YafY
MATNKRAQIRYRALDNCFRNKYKRFYIWDLIDRCNEVLTDHIGKPVTISRRQVLDDIRFMKSEAGYNAPIESFRDGKQAYYRYEDSDFSIEKSPINPEEMEQISDALEIFSRISGLPNFEWMAELETKLRDSIQTQNNHIISFDSNPYLKGIDFLRDLYAWIKNKSVLRISYQSFSMEMPKDFIIHPYHLKQFNNRWFLFGLNSDVNKIQNLPLDRIQNIEFENRPFIDCDVDFEEYFEDIVGVTNPEDQEVEEIVLEFSAHRLPYVLSKPIHGSQRYKENKVYLSLKINKEFLSSLMAFGADVQVLSPQNLKTILLEEAKKIISNNECSHTA